MRHSDTPQCTYIEHDSIALITILSDYIILQIACYILPCIHIYDMAHQKALKTGIVAAILLVTIILTTQQQPIQASNDRQQRSSDDAVTAGWKEGKNDYLNGDANEYSCSSSMPDTYCSLYRMGYQQGWNAQESLGRQPGSDPQ